MMENQLGPTLQEYAEMIKQQRALYANAPWVPKPQPRPEPQEDPAEQQRLRELLDGVKNQTKETK